MKKLILCMLLLMAGCGKEDAANNPTGPVPILSTAGVTGIATSVAVCGGTITSDGGAAVTARGVCWSSVQIPVIGDSKTVDGTDAGSFVSAVSGLNPNTRYYVRAYATNMNGTGYGDMVSFTTLQSGQITDIDGNVYNSVTIGTQTWMVENLKVTKYNDGTPLPEVTNAVTWKTSTTPAYCWYNNDAESYKNVYGAMYNWYAVHTGKLAPSGWHVPTDDEWKTLELFLGMTQVQADALGFRGSREGGMLKEAGVAHWLYPNKGADNSSGFTALPGGRRINNGTFAEFGSMGAWWSATEENPTRARYRSLINDDSRAYRNDDYKFIGLSVRCVKD